MEKGIEEFKFENECCMKRYLFVWKEYLYSEKLEMKNDLISQRAKKSILFSYIIILKRSFVMNGIFFKILIYNTIENILILLAIS